MPRLWSLIFLVSILAFSQSQPPAPTKSTQKDQHKPNPKQQKASTDEQSSVQPSSGVDQERPVFARRNKEQSRQESKKETTTDWWPILNSALSTRLVTTAVSAEPIQGDPVQMLFKQTSIIGSAHNHPTDLVDILGLVAMGKVKPQLEIYPLDEVNRVLARLVEGKVRHRAVLTHS